MTPRSSRLATLVRVAELQEAVARGEAGRALVASRAAEQVHAQQLAVLRARRLEGGRREAVLRSSATQLALASATTRTEQASEEAATEQQAALASWTQARLRHRLLTELAERQREQLRADRDRQEQQLADELSASRRYPR